MQIEKIQPTEQEMEKMDQKVSDEELDGVSGGFEQQWRLIGGKKYTFTEQEAKTMSEELHIEIIPGKKYYIEELNEMGIPSVQYLKEHFGFEEKITIPGIPVIEKGPLTELGRTTF